MTDNDTTDGRREPDGADRAEGADGTATADGDGEATLTRRDVTAALTATGATAVLGGALTWASLGADGTVEGADEGDAPEGFDEHERATLVALAETLYPSAVSGIPSFVERYTVGRVRDRPDYAAGMREAVGTLDEYAREWYEDEYAALDAAAREDTLAIMGASTADPDPEGIDPERVRFYLVNELLFALYTTPTGAELVGIENPQGYPGGTTSYRRPPDRSE